MLYHRNGKLDVDAWHEIRESNLPPFTDVELPENPPAVARMARFGAGWSRDRRRMPIAKKNPNTVNMFSVAGFARIQMIQNTCRH